MYSSSVISSSLKNSPEAIDALISLIILSQSFESILFEAELFFFQKFFYGAITGYYVLF